MSELTEREYLALSAVVDVEGGLLRFDMVGDIPEDVFLTLQKAKLITPRLGGYRATRPGLLVMREYRAAQPPAAETGARGDVSPTVGDVLRAGVAAADRAFALEAENNRLREKLAAAQLALKQIVGVWKLWNDGAMSDVAAIVRMHEIAQQATGGEGSE